MDDLSFYLLLGGIIAFFIIANFIRQERWAAPKRTNFRILAQELNLKITQGFFSAKVEGEYRGRMVRIHYSYSFYGGTLWFYLVPKQVPAPLRKCGLFLCLRPTRNTSLSAKGELFYNPSLWPLGKINPEKRWTDGLRVLDELTRAAEIVERGEPYYKELPEVRISD